MLGWKIQEEHDSIFKVKEGLFSSGLTGNPVTLEILLTEQSPRETKVVFQASNFGFGPLNTNRCKKVIETVASAIKRAATPFVALAEGLICSTCGKILPPGTKFCDKDGTPILKVCPSCKFSNTPGAQFCSNCGAQL